MKTFVAVLAAGLFLFGIFILWQENERRYAALAMTGCYADTRSMVARFDSAGLMRVVSGCAAAMRLCREAPPLLDWRGACAK